MILHLIVDDKFIDVAHDLFEAAAPGKNRFFTLVAGDCSGNTKYIRNFQPEVATLREFVDLVRCGGVEDSGVVIHWMSDLARAVTARLPKAIPVAWVGWGGDYYHLIRSRESLLRPQTRDLMAKLKPVELPGPMLRAQTATKGVRSLLRWVKRMSRPGTGIGDLGQGQAGERRVLSRVDFFAPVIREDAEMIKSRQEWFRAEVLSWNYPIRNAIFDAIERDEHMAGDDILLGNSATPENNHLDAMEVLQGVSLGARRVICPLSYGDPAYGRAVALEGKKRFGDKFVPLTKFLGPEDYWKAIRTCSYVLMPHLRQQAGGNIVMMLYAGARITLDAENPMARFLKRNGLPFTTFGLLPDEIQGQAERVQSCLPEVRETLRSLFGYDTALTRTQALIERLNSPKPLF